MHCKDVAPHSHEVLVGKALDYSTDPPTEVWKTSLAAEYPAGLCEAWADSLRAWLEANWKPRANSNELIRVAPNVLVRRDMVRG